MNRRLLLFGFLLRVLMMGNIAFAGPTMVAGNVSGIWDMAGSPYYLTDNCTVPIGQKLSIEPGVVVNIGENLSLTVNGWVEAIGTQQSRISIRSPSDSVFWDQILVNFSASGVSKFYFCDFSNATNAIHIRNAAFTNLEMINEIQNCKFNNCSDNAVLVAAQGTFKSNSPAAPTAYRPFASPIIDGCTIKNSNNGITLYVNGSSWPNTMGTWYTYGGSSPVITNNVFDTITDTAIYMDKGTIITNNSFPKFINNTIKRSTKAIFNQPPYDALAKNNIFYENGVGIERVDANLSSGVFSNNFFNNGTDFNGYPSSYGQIVMVNANGDPCDIGFNIFLDPLFSDTTSYHLTFDSPCINAALSEDAPEIDIDGDSRPQGSGIDIGADEFLNVTLVADAGPDQVVCRQICDAAILDGRRSRALNSTITSYEWELKYRGDSSFDQDASGETPSVFNLIIGVYDVILTITDDVGFTATDQTTLTVIETCNACSIMKGDLDSDGDVDGDDLKIFSQNYGSIVLTP